MSKNSTVLNTALSLEDICRRAYDAKSIESVADLKSELSAMSGCDLPYVRDALLSHLLWTQECLCTKSKGVPGVYVVEYADGRVKIGKTKDFNGRLKSLQAMSSAEITQSFFRPISKHSKAEHLMHVAFSEDRMHSEFFTAAYEDVVARLGDVAGEVEQ